MSIFSNSFVSTLLSAFLVTMLFCSCQKEEIINCEDLVNYGTFQLKPESFSHIPYQGNEKLIFKNQTSGEEMIFIPRQNNFPVPNYESHQSAINCGESQTVRTHIAEKRELNYTSSQKYNIHIKLKVQQVTQEGEEPVFFDHLDVMLYKPLFDADENLTGTDECHAHIITSMRQGEKTAEFAYENSGLINPPKVEYHYALNEQLYESVYIGQGEKLEKIVYSAAYGVLEFVDLEGQTWVFERKTYYDEVFAPEVSMPDVNGNLLKLSEVDADLILLDFWASWCAPCREETVNTLSPLYESFKDKGLEIYSVSIDTEKEEWIKAIEEDNMTWLNVCDLQAYDSPVFADYQVLGIPAIYLIDADGKIIAKDLRDEDLKNFVENYLQ